MVNYLRDKRIRLALTGGIVIVVLAAVLPYFVNYVSYSAYVNAELVRISAPISGTVAHALPSDGDYIREDRTLRLLEAVAPDRHRLAELEQQHASSGERLALAQRHLEAVEAREAELSTRADGFADFAKAITVQDAALYEAELTTCRVEQERLRDERDRARQLSGTGAAPRLTLTLANAALEAQAARCGAAEARLERARIKQRAAENDIYLEDGFNDTPYSLQELDRLFLRRLDLEAEVNETEVLHRELTGLIDEERQRFDRATRFEATLPGEHVVWSVQASEGTAVVEGQTLMELADCRRRFVSVRLSERAVSAVEQGDSAAVRLVGSRHWFKGHVVSVSGSAARRNEGLLAAEAPEPGPRRFLVKVELPQGALGDDDADRCGVGRLAEVRFHRFGIGLPFFAFLGPRADAQPA